MQWIIQNRQNVKKYNKNEFLSARRRRVEIFGFEGPQSHHFCMEMVTVSTFDLFEITQSGVISASMFTGA